MITNKIKWILDIRVNFVFTLFLDIHFHFRIQFDLIGNELQLKIEYNSSISTQNNNTGVDTINRLGNQYKNYGAQIAKENISTVTLFSRYET